MTAQMTAQSTVAAPHDRNDHEDTASHDLIPGSIALLFMK